jgi:hypothetical protein
MEFLISGEIFLIHCFGGQIFGRYIPIRNKKRKFAKTMRERRNERKTYREKELKARN